MVIQVPSLILDLFFILLTLPTASAFDRDSCFKKAQDLLSNYSISATGHLFFRDTFDSPPYNGVENMTLTLNGCNELCGSKQTWYTDIGPRMTVWLIPILLLIANVELSPLDKRRFLAVLHLLGDPIDSFWSLLHKLDAWDRCAAFAARRSNACPSCQRVIASVFAGYEEVQGPRIQCEHCFEELIQQRSLATHFNEWRRAAVRLADGRTNEIGRTAFALLLYIFQLVAAFVPNIGGAGPGPPGGRIATAVLLSWLVPATLLSSAVGNLTSRRTAYDIMADLTANTGEDTFQIGDQRSVFLPSFPSVAQASATEYFRALGWSGGIYTYRPWKLHYITSTHHRRLHTIMLASLAAAPVLIGLIGGVLILWHQLPVGINCRHVWLVGVALLWNISAFVTVLSHGLGLATGKYHWRLTVAKDAAVAIPSFLTMFLSAVGAFNSCYCWSGPFQYPGKGRVPMPETAYLKNARSVYPTIVGVALLMEIVVVGVVAVVWRRGLRLLRWSEKSRRREWERVVGREVCGCACGGGDDVGKSRQSSWAEETGLLKSGVRVAFAEVER
jgi:hypothetical protein